MRHKTLLDIAKIAGVSPSTVSRALRDHPDISDKTISEIKKIAEKYNFSPNPIAQGLKNNKTKTIGVIVPAIKHDFFSTAISGIEEEVYKAGYTLILCQSNEEYEREVINVNLLLNHRVAGIIVSISENTKNGNHFKKVIQKKTPLVFFDRACGDITATKIIVNDRKGAFDAVSFLIKKGYKKIAHFAGPEKLSNAGLRTLGYLDALKEYNFKINKNLIFSGGMNEDDGYKAMEKVLKMKNKPDAIFAVNDPVAIGAFQKMKEAGIKIPKDIALVGFSNNKITSLVDPQITTMEQYSFEMGKKAAEVIISKIEKNNFKKNETIVIDAKLIIRNSA